MDDSLTARVIGCAMEVHRHLGPGLLESVYETCLCQELADEGVKFERQVMLPVTYKTRPIDAAYRIDLLVAGKVIVEIKAVEKLLPIHEAQLLTYLRLARLPPGLLLNFQNVVLRHGIRRLSLKPPLT
ncbi:MAG: GxxExxY protein [Acetobacteraceae bacterium]|nr:GxxExxY protein [Acetobacteraceae bacterium]